MKTSSHVAALSAAFFLMMPTIADAQVGVPIFQPGDPILGIDADPPTGGFTPGNSSSPANGGENALFALDQNPFSKYLNFGKEGSGLIVRPLSGPSIVRTMVLTTANDAPDRDPTSYKLWGTNDVLDLVALNHTEGLVGNWRLISEGSVALTNDRNVVGSAISLTPANTGDFDSDNDSDGADFLTWQRNSGRTGTGTRAFGDANGDTNVNAADLAVWQGQFGLVGGAGTSFSTYRLVFPAIKNSGAADSMQIGDIDLFTSTDGTGTSIVSVDDPVAAIDMPTVVALIPDSAYPSNEAPMHAIDNDIGTKYFNNGEENSGFIITPAVGASKVTSFIITTGNDRPGRDPTSWILQGTNDPITSADNSTGLAENWTLISQGALADALALPEGRQTPGPEVTFVNTTAYASYRMVFPTLKDAGAEGAIQYSEVQFYGTIGAATAAIVGVPEPNSALLAMLGVLFAGHARPGLRRTQR